MYPVASVMIVLSILLLLSLSASCENAEQIAISRNVESRPLPLSLDLRKNEAYLRDSLHQRILDHIENNGPFLPDNRDEDTDETSDTLDDDSSGNSETMNYDNWSGDYESFGNYESLDIIHASDLTFSQNQQTKDEGSEELEETLISQIFPQDHQTKNNASEESLEDSRSQIMLHGAPISAYPQDKILEDNTSEQSEETYGDEETYVDETEQTYEDEETDDYGNGETYVDETEQTYEDEETDNYGNGETYADETDGDEETYVDEDGNEETYVDEETYGNEETYRNEESIETLRSQIMLHGAPISAYPQDKFLEDNTSEQSRNDYSSQILFHGAPLSEIDKKDEGLLWLDSSDHVSTPFASDPSNKDGSHASDPSLDASEPIQKETSAPERDTRSHWSKLTANELWAIRLMVFTLMATLFLLAWACRERIAQIKIQKHTYSSTSTTNLCAEEEDRFNP